MPIVPFLRDNARFLAAGFFLALASSFGQTFFIALFSEPLRQEFGLSHGQFGAIYMTATLASAACLIPLGRTADTVHPRLLALGVLLGLASVCALMAGAGSWPILAAAIFGLRLFGQGMLSHLSQTVMARWFVASRGRALAVASFGYPAGEALAPLAAIALIAALGWRETWALAGLALALVFVPALWLLLSRDRTPSAADAAGNGGAGLDGRHWTRGEVVRQPLFWIMIPGILAPSFILTVVFFLPAHIAETKGWAFETLPAQYWVFAISSVAAAFASGAALDRFSARACLPFYQLPMAAGLLVLWLASGPQAVPALMILFGLTAGSAATLNSALWAEIYGTRNIGAIRSMAHAGMVFSTAIGPGLTGMAIDAGVPFPIQGLWLAGYSAAVSIVFALIAVRTARAANAPAPAPKPESGLPL